MQPRGVWKILGMHGCRLGGTGLVLVVTVFTHGAGEGGRLRCRTLQMAKLLCNGW